MGRRTWNEDTNRCLKLSGNGSVSITFKGNLFDLSVDERNLLNRLAEVIEQHKEKANGNVTA